jgi:hypothetical protein
MVPESTTVPRGWPDPHNTPWGYFIGHPKTEWLFGDDGDRMRLCQDFAYWDRRSIRWVAREGLEFDGASKPRFLWWGGGPYEGRYRRAAIIHDALYHDRRVDRATADRVFYEGMRADGVSATRALLYYWAVRWFGPRWEPE